MKINKHNYEAFFLDYQEGNLDECQVAELMLFLEQNPELKEELEEISSMVLESSLDVFQNKNRLKRSIIPTKNINENNYEDFLIAEVEQILNKQEKAELETFLAENTSVEKERALFSNTILKPVKINYSKKGSLKKKTKVVQMFWVRQVGVAASIALLLGVYLFTKNVDNTYRPRTVRFAQMNIREEVEKLNLPIIIPKTEISSKSAKHKIQTVRKLNHNKSEESFSFIANNTLAPENNPEPNKELFSIKEKKIENKEMAPNNKFWTVSEPTQTTSKEISPKDYLAETLNKKLFKEKAVEPINSNLLTKTVKTINKVFKTKLKLEKSFDEEGELYAYTIQAGKYNLNRKISQ